VVAGLEGRSPIATMLLVVAYEVVDDRLGDVGYFLDLMLE
jgi:hypothetical protein